MKALILFLKALAFILITGAVYFSYTQRSHFELVIGSFVFLIAVFALEYFLPYWQDHKNMRERKRKSIRKTQEIYAEKAELEVLRKEVAELKQMFPILTDTVQTLAGSLKEIKETISNTVDSKSDYISLIKDTLLRDTAAKSSEEEKDIFNKAVEALKFLKSKGQAINFSIDDIARCVFLERDCLIAKSLIFAKENNILPSDFIERVRQFLEDDLTLEFKGEKYTTVAFKNGDCVYVNFALLRDTYKHLLEDDNQSKQLEPYFAYLFKDYLCSSINWKNGFIKKLFEVKENNKVSKRPLIVLKEEFFKDVNSKKNIEILS